MTFNQFIEHCAARGLNPRREGASWKVLSPLRAEKTGSLDVREKNGRIVLHDHGDPSATVQQICAALGIKVADLFPRTTQRKIAATYDYTDKAGQLLFQAVRYEPKGFSQRHPDSNGGWVDNLHGVPRVLYHLPAVLAAETVFFVEGEKDADTLNARGFVATTNPMGAGKWREEYAESLRGKNVVILADNDGPGREHARTVALSLHLRANSIKLIEKLPAPGEQSVKDVSEWFAVPGMDEKLLGALVADAPVWTPEEQKDEKQTATAENEPKAYTPAELRAMVSDIVEPIVFPFAVRGMFSLLDGQSKAAGKTTALLHAVRAMLREETFLGKATKRVKVLYVTEEYRRTFLMALGRVDLLDDDSGFFTIMPRDEWSKYHPWPVLAQHLFERCRREGIGWCITDTFYSVAGFRNPDQENDAALVDAAAAPLRTIAGELDIPVTTTRHERKGGGTIGESGRGSTALTGAVDIIVRLQRLTGSPTTVRELEITGRIDADCITAELKDGRYIIRTGDPRTNAIDEIQMVADAIGEQPTASLRTISKRTGVTRPRLCKVAKLAGWTMEETGWVRMV